MSRLERLTHLALIALCVVSIGLLLEHRFAGGATTAPAAESLIGKSLKVRGADWAASQTHAVLFVNSHCHYCTESAPFYRRLVGALQDGRAAALAVLSTEPVEVTRKFLSDEGIAANNVYQVTAANGLRNTPTVLIVDAHGVVRRVFVGKLDELRQETILEAVSTGRQ